MDSGDYTAGGFDCQWAGKLEFVLTCGLALVVLPRRGHNPAGPSPEAPDKLKAASAAFLLPAKKSRCSIREIPAHLGV
ncbi:uncharacterized protein METZ01_LOCUS436000, partial [marine metagenome]